MTLDLIRGVAVLGILAINVAGFAGPSIGATTPNIPTQGTVADNFAFGFAFLFFEGKMRAIFAMLFGASLLLHIQRNEAAGHEGDILQVRRLFWLMIFGWLHYLLLWWGDILFTYGLCGLAVLLLRGVPTRLLLAFSLTSYLVWHAWGFAEQMPSVMREETVRRGIASATDVAVSLEYLDQLGAWAQNESVRYLSGFAEIFLAKVRDEPTLPWTMAASSFGEVLPLMLIGLILQRSGFFEDHWPRRRVALMATMFTALGLAMTSTALIWLAPRGYPPVAMRAALLYGMAIPHLLTALGYTAMLVLIAPRLSGSRLGQRVIAAGRAAFSNYIGTSLVMTGLFYGWGLGLFGRCGAAAQWAFVFFGWMLMLGWSKLWLARFRRGPLEWVWRSATLGVVLPNRRQPD